MYQYYAYGLGILSEFYLPELIAEQRKIDVNIRRGNLENLLQSFITGEEAFRATESEIFRNYQNIASFHIRNGNEIVVDLAPGIDEGLFRSCLLGNILGTLLHQRGLLVLHGSAIAANGGAVAFLGPSGSGKSTAAASLCSEGYSILTDDVVAIDAEGDVPIIHPAFPRLNLWPDVAKSLGYDLNALSYIIPTENKRFARLDSKFSQDSLPLKRIYLLENGVPIDIRRLNQQESMIELVRNSYAVKTLTAGIYISNHFLQCSKVIKSVPICRLVRPFDFKYIHDVAYAVMDDISSI